jgi:hypothetical protein
MVNRAQRLISKAEFATEAGVSRAAVTKACVGILKDAVDGGKIDIDHADAKAYILNKRKVKTPKKPAAKKTPKKTPTVKKQKKKKPEPEEPEEPHYSKDKDIEHVLQMTISELITTYGTDAQFKAWADAKKVLSEIRLKNLKIAEAEGSLIPRDMVRLHIFGAIEAANLRLLADTPKTLARRLYALAKAGESIEEAESLTRSLMGDQLKSLKATATRLLKKNK